MRALLIGLCAAAIATPALAEADLTSPTPGITYFNKPGADRAQHDAALRRCLGLSFQMRQPPNNDLLIAAAIPGLGVLGAAIAGGIEGAIEGAANGAAASRAVSANVENCMVSSGWRVIMIADATGPALVKLGKTDHEALAAKLTPWIGAETPPGELVREFENDAGDSLSTLYQPAYGPQTTSLSLKIFDPKVAGAPAATEPPKLPHMQRTAYPPSPLGRDGLGAPAAESALVVVQVSGPAGHSGERLVFTRVGPDIDTPAWVDGRPAEFGVILGADGVGGGSRISTRTAIFSLPPGRWRLSEMQKGPISISLCMGSPAFDLAAGDVVFAGTFALGARSLGPDLGIAPAQAALAGSPAAAGLKPAVYINGVPGRCDGTYLYALEAVTARH